jgi:integrase
MIVNWLTFTKGRTIGENKGQKGGDIMRKAWLYKRKNRPGWYVRWYGDDGKQRSLRLPNRVEAENYRLELHRQMNEGLFFEPLNLQWDDLVDRYFEYLTYVRRLSPGTIESYTHALANFRRICGPVLSTEFDRGKVEQYVAARTRAGLSPATINKDIRTLRALARWAIKRRYMGAVARRIDWSDLRQRVTPKPVRTATLAELSRLLAAARRLYGASWHVRLILAISTGLRLRDIERLTVADVDLEAGTLAAVNAKAHKAKQRPLHPIARRVLADYIAGLPADQERLLTDLFHDTKWRRIKEAAGVEGLTYHDLRRSFASFILRAGYSTSVAQDLLDHSTPNLTHQIYGDCSPVYRDAVSAVPLEAALTMNRREAVLDCLRRAHGRDIE